MADPAVSNRELDLGRGELPGRILIRPQCVARLHSGKSVDRCIVHARFDNSLISAQIAPGSVHDRNPSFTQRAPANEWDVMRVQPVCGRHWCAERALPDEPMQKAQYAAR